MQSMKSLSKTEAINIIEKVAQMNADNPERTTSVGSLFSFKDAGSDVYHNVIILNCEEDIL